MVVGFATEKEKFEESKCMSLSYLQTFNGLYEVGEKLLLHLSLQCSPALDVHFT